MFLQRDLGRRRKINTRLKKVKSTLPHPLISLVWKKKKKFNKRHLDVSVYYVSSKELVIVQWTQNRGKPHQRTKNFFLSIYFLLCTFHWFYSGKSLHVKLNQYCSLGLLISALNLFKILSDQYWINWSNQESSLKRKNEFISTRKTEIIKKTLTKQMPVLIVSQV